MADPNIRPKSAGTWVLVVLAAIVVIGVGVLVWAPRDESADKAGAPTTQQESPETGPADKPRDQTDNTNP